MAQVAVIHSAFSDRHNPHVVAFVEVGDRTGTAALEYAYERTQNIQGSWSQGPVITWDGVEEANGDYSEDITVMAPLTVNDDGNTLGLRSTSMDDQMLFEGKKYTVAMFGFEELV